MDRVKQAQITNLRVWCRRFNVEFDEARAVRAIDSASNYPGMEGSTRRLPLALIFSKKIGENFPELPVDVRQFLSVVFSIVMLEKTYHGDNSPWEVLVEQKINELYARNSVAGLLIEKTRAVVASAGEWWQRAHMARVKEKGTLGGMLSRALRNPQLMED